MPIPDYERVPLREYITTLVTIRRRLLDEGRSDEAADIETHIVKLCARHAFYPNPNLT